MNREAISKDPIYPIYPVGRCIHRFGPLDLMPNQEERSILVTNVSSLYLSHRIVEICLIAYQTITAPLVRA